MPKSLSLKMSYISIRWSASTPASRNASLSF